MDEQGWFYLVDRSKDMIVASGFKVWPREVEEVLYQHPAVREAAVVGIPDPYRGETIKAVISLKPGQTATADEIRAFVARAHGRVQVSARRRDHGRAAEDDERQDHAPAAAADGARERDPRAGASSSTCRTRSCASAVEARAVLEAGATWLRLSRGRIPLSTSAALYERLRLMLAQIGDGGAFVDRDAFLAANEAYHAAVIDLAENEHLSPGFRRLRLRDLFAAALKDTPVAAEHVVYFHEYLTDSLAAGDAAGALKAILSWGKQSRHGRAPRARRRRNDSARRAAPRRHRRGSFRSPWPRSRTASPATSTRS